MRMLRMNRSSAWACGLALAAAAFLAAVGRSGATADPFDAMTVQRPTHDVQAPGFRLRTLEDKPLALEDLRGKVVAFYFWRTW